MSASTLTDQRVNVPEGRSGNVTVTRFAVPEHSIQNLRLALTGRGCAPGEYTALERNGRLWMSDTTAEWDDHRAAYYAMQQHGGRILINGLGLGMIVKAALELDNVEHIDVVECDPDVIALVGPTYQSDRCTIHQADAYTINWPTGTRWTVAWHDIWPSLCEDNLPLMAKLHRKYGRRVAWQGSWGKELLRAERRRTANASWRRY